MEPCMPGAWICDKCGFVLQKSVLHTMDGSIGADTSPLNEHCPNDNVLMRPYTWREANEALYARATSLMEEKSKLEAELRAVLDGCKDSVRVCEGGGPEDLAASIAVTVAKLAESRDHSRRWWAVRFARLEEWARQELSLPLQNRFFAITANGTAEPFEPPNYSTQLNLLRLEADSLRAANQELRKKLVAQEHTKGCAIHTTLMDGGPGHCSCGKGGER